MHAIDVRISLVTIRNGRLKETPPKVLEIEALYCLSHLRVIIIPEPQSRTALSQWLTIFLFHISVTARLPFCIMPVYI